MEPNKDKIRVYIDMDHTFCDFENALGFWKKRALTEIEKRYPWSMRGFFESLLPMPGALDFWNKWSDVAEKAEWVFKYLGEEGVKKLIISPQKDLLIGDILIDDHDGCGQPSFNGSWWQFGSDKCKGWENIDELMTDYSVNRPNYL